MIGFTTMRRRVIGMAWLTALWASSLRAQPITPDDPGPGDLKFTISAAGAARPISPYIYGVNFYGGSGFTNPVTLDRLGGNRWTGYNWETNSSNAGRDWYYQNDSYMGSGPPGDAVEDSLDAASAARRALVVTVPISGYVAGDTAGPVQQAQALDHSRFKEIVPLKETKYPGSSLSLAPDEVDPYVFTDEYVNWVEQNKGAAQVFYSLDNEPGLWGETLPAGWQPGVPTSVQPGPQGRTHGALHPYAPTFQELRDKTIANASAIKSVNPAAMVFGGVGYGWNDFVTLQGAPDMSSRAPVVDYDGNDKGEMSFYEYLLDSLKREDDARGLTAQGRSLMDVLDLHWYSEARSGADPDTNPGVRISDENSANPSAAVIAARVQAPRSLWDPTYAEVSWISKWSVGNGAGNFGQVKLLPRVQQDIDLFKPGTKIAITEYNYGGGQHISGGVAQADALGVFGAEGVFAASYWPLGDKDNSTNATAENRFASGAMKMYVDYDGAAGNGQYGDLAIDAATDNISQSAVYASLDSDDPTRMVLVAINRTTAAKDVALQVTADRRFDLAEVYQLTSASANPVRKADLSIDLVNAFHYSMPAMSVTTLVLRSFIDGDFNMDGQVTAGDLVAWSTNAGMTSGAHFGDGDNDRDGDVDGDDFLAWQRNLGAAAPATAYYASVPEPSALLLALAAGLSFNVIRRRTAREFRE